MGAEKTRNGPFTDLEDCGPRNLCPIGSLPVYDSQGDFENCGEPVCTISGMIPNPWFTDFKQQQIHNMLECRDIKPHQAKFVACGSSCGLKCPKGYGFSCMGGMCIDKINKEEWDFESKPEPDFDSPTEEECMEKYVKYNKSCINKEVNKYDPEMWLDSKDGVVGTEYLLCGRTSLDTYGRCPQDRPLCVQVQTIGYGQNFCVNDDDIQRPHGCPRRARQWKLKKNWATGWTKMVNIKEPLWEFSHDGTDNMCDDFPEPANWDEIAAGTDGLPHPIQSQKCVHMCTKGSIGWGPEGHTCDPNNTRQVC